MCPDESPLIFLPQRMRYLLATGIASLPPVSPLGCSVGRVIWRNIPSITTSALSSQKIKTLFLTRGESCQGRPTLAFIGDP